MRKRPSRFRLHHRGGRNTNGHNVAWAWPIGYIGILNTLVVGNWCVRVKSFRTDVTFRGELSGQNRDGHTDVNEFDRSSW